MDCGMKDLLEIFENDLSLEDVVAAKLLGEISAAIAKKRIDMNMTQKEFAAYLNVSQGMVSRWEGSTYNYTIRTLVEIFSKLDLSVELRIVGKPKKKEYSGRAGYMDNNIQYRAVREKS